MARIEGLCDIELGAGDEGRPWAYSCKVVASEPRLGILMVDVYGRAGIVDQADRRLIHSSAAVPIVAVDLLVVRGCLAVPGLWICRCLLAPDSDPLKRSREAPMSRGMLRN
jgi:hypothetical protein